MKLECVVLLQKSANHSMSSSSSNNCNRQRRPSKAILTLAKCYKNLHTGANLHTDGGNVADGKIKFELIIHTISNRNELSIALNNTSVQSVHARFVNDGRATLRFAEPALDIFISEAVPDRLKRFLLLLSNAIKGVGVGVGAEASAAAAAAEGGDRKVAKTTTNENQQMQQLRPSSPKDRRTIRMAPSRLIITTMKEYPRLQKGFPAHLTELTLVGLGLKRIDSRWFGLRQLLHLDLSCNLLGEAIDFAKKFLNITRLCRLKQLSLAQNNIANFSDEQWLALPNSLVSFDISDNLLTGSLPRSIAHLKHLASLSAQANRLKRLPTEICEMSSLRVLRLNDNNLNYVPASIRCLRLDFIDLTGNEQLFKQFTPYIRVLPTKLPTLLQITSAFVHNQRLALDELPWDLKISLCNETVICSICRNSSPKDFALVQYCRMDLSMIAHTVTRRTDGEGSVVRANYNYCRNCAKFSFHPIF